MMQLPQAANTATGWQDFLKGLSTLSLDYARFKLIDVERTTDDLNIPDRTDMSNGILAQPAAGGMTIGGWLVLGVVVVAGGLLLRRLVK